MPLFQADQLQQDVDISKYLKPGREIQVQDAEGAHDSDLMERTEPPIAPMICDEIYRKE